MSYLYEESLDAEALSRYKFKLGLIGIESCPYKFPADRWKEELKEWPDLQPENVFFYLIKSPRLYSAEAMENKKSLEAHIFFESGWVHNVFHMQTDAGYILMKADVKPSWRVTDEPHHPWVAIKKTGPVVTAHCDCMAGLGETCSHVGALLFKIEAAVRLGYTKTAPTDVACAWNSYHVKKVQSAPVSEIKFYKQKAKDRLHRSKKIPKSEQVDATDEEQQQFLKSLASIGENIIGLSSYSQYSDRFSDLGPVPAERKLPTLLRSLYMEKNCLLSNLELKELCHNTYKNLSVTTEESQYLEEVSRQQASSSVWHHHRIGRITSSVAYEILHTDQANPAKSLLKKICVPSNVKLRVPAVIWGTEHEDDAFCLYGNIYCGDNDKTPSVVPSGEVFASHPGPHENCTFQKSGFIVCLDRPYLGASPDGLVNCSCCGKGVIEIKCPFKYKSVEIKNFFQDTDFPINSKYQLKKQNKYYAQVQHQIYVCGASYADFVLWTPIDVVVVRVSKDENFIGQMLQSYEQIWKNAVLPELLCRKMEIVPDKVDLPVSQTYCYCKTSNSSDDMVGCDRCDDWFHPKCVNLKRLPKSKTWYCPDCKKTIKKQKL